MAEANNNNQLDQNAVNAAVAAAVRYMAQNPIAGVNGNLAVNNFHIFQNMTKYKGDYNANIWLEEFNHERQTYNLDASWAIRNLEKVLEDTPKLWWLSQKSPFITRLAAAGADAGAIWTDVENAVRGFFSETNIKERARAENITIRFSVGQDPTDYVARKLDCLSRVDANMTMDDKIRHLLMGLPENLRALVSPGDINTVEAFFRQLSRQLSINKKMLSRSHRGTEKPESFKFRSMRTKNSGNANSPKKTMQKIPGLEIPRYSDEHRRACVDNDGKRLCWHCRKPGHRVMMCYTLAREQGLEVPAGQSSSRRNSVHSVAASEN